MIDDDGRIVVVWRQAMRMQTVRVRGGARRKAGYVVRARDKLATEVARGPATMLSSNRRKVGRHEVGIDGGGAVATWHWGTGTPPFERGNVGQVQVSERMQDGSWTAAQRISRSRLCASMDDPRVAVDARGHAVIWWR